VIKNFSAKFILLGILILTLAIFGCATDTESPAQESDSAASEPEPTFVRVTITPVPIDTPAPAPLIKSRFTTEQLADPVFPDWLDTELSDEQPDDEALFAAWQEHLTDTLIYYTSSREVPVSRHFCAEGIIADVNGEIDAGYLWDVTRTAAMSSSDWGKVALTADVLADGGRPFTFMTISRETEHSSKPAVHHRSN
jgi:hypothetical protein